MSAAPFSITHVDAYLLAAGPAEAAALQAAVESSAKRLGAVLTVTIADPSTPSPSDAAVCGWSHVPRWSAEMGDAAAAIANTVPARCRFACLVVGPAAASAPTADGDVVFAVERRGIPALVLVPQREGPTTQYPRQHPLLTVSAAADPSAAVECFLTFPPQQGRVIVVEGGDGAGKQTQVALLCARLRAEGYPTDTLDFPHDAAAYGVLIRELLSGRMGNIKEVNPLIFAALYGLNRHSTLPVLQYWLQRGSNIVLDRYMTANYGHQASKFDNDDERIAAINTLRTFELRWLGLPEADRVLYLNLPPEVALRAMRQDTTRQALDMHELAGLDYKDKVRRSFLWCCQTFSGDWAEVPCVEGAPTVGADGRPSYEDNRRYSREEVHEAVFGLVRDTLVNQKQ